MLLLLLLEGELERVVDRDGLVVVLGRVVRLDDRVVVGRVVELFLLDLVVDLTLVGRVVDLMFDRVLARLRVVVLKTLRLLKLLEFLYLDLPPLM